MRSSNIFLLLPLIIFIVIKSSGSSVVENEGFCPDPDFEELWSNEQCTSETFDPGDDPNFRLRLPKHAGKVGSLKDIDFPDGRTLTRHTLALKPLLFEFNNFLSSAECELLIKAASKKGMKSGATQSFNQRTKPPSLYDMNYDRELSVDEMRLTIEDSYDIYLSSEEVIKMYAELDLDKNQDLRITPNEIPTKATFDRIGTYVGELAKAHPSRKGRDSQLSWLFPNQMTDPQHLAIVERVRYLLQLPQAIMNKSDIQIVKYGNGGHYNVHLDSGSKDKAIPCCHRFRGSPSRCRSCRWATILFYLNDVEEGGQTAFPVADNKTFSADVLRENFMIDLHKKCDEGNLRVSPKKGKAILWYNHYDPSPTSDQKDNKHEEEEKEWFGEMDKFSEHGSCPVGIKSIKWAANFWIKITDSKEFDLMPTSSDKFIV